MAKKCNFPGILQWLGTDKMGIYVQFGPAILSYICEDNLKTSLIGGDEAGIFARDFLILKV